MSFVTKDLSVMAYANGFTLWHYATTNAAADLNAAGYFNGAADMLRVGDMIIANGGMHESRWAGVLTVVGNHKGAVTMAPLLATPAQFFTTASGEAQ